jgi:hypothetical protein
MALGTGEPSSRSHGSGLADHQARAVCFLRLVELSEPWLGVGDEMTLEHGRDFHLTRPTIPYQA